MDVISENQHKFDFFVPIRRNDGTADAKVFTVLMGQDKASAKHASDRSVSAPTIKGVIDNYVNSREMNNKEEVGERFEGLTREVVDQKLTGTKVICEKLMRVDATGNYKSYVAIELSAQDLLAAYNERLSQRRAESVVAYLIKNGIDKSRLQAKGYGETKLVNNCGDGKKCSDAEHQKNRRTEFMVVGELK